jgi:hypothetical protein
VSCGRPPPDDYDSAELRLLEEFGGTLPDAERRALHDPFLVLPFANLKDGYGRRKAHGIGGSKLP